MTVKKLNTKTSMLLFYDKMYPERIHKKMTFSIKKHLLINWCYCSETKRDKGHCSVLCQSEVRNAGFLQTDAC